MTTILNAFPRLNMTSQLRGDVLPPRLSEAGG